MPVQVLVLSSSVICKYTSPTRCKLCIKGKNTSYIVLTITFYESCFLDMGQKKKFKYPKLRKNDREICTCIHTQDKTAFISLIMMFLQYRKKIR